MLQLSLNFPSASTSFLLCDLTVRTTPAQQSLTQTSSHSRAHYLRSSVSWSRVQLKSCRRDRGFLSWLLLSSAVCPFCVIMCLLVSKCNLPAFCPHRPCWLADHVCELRALAPLSPGPTHSPTPASNTLHGFRSCPRWHLGLKPTPSVTV